MLQSPIPAARAHSVKRASKEEEEGGGFGGAWPTRPEDEDADEDDAVEARGGVDVLLGAAPRRGEPGLERCVGAARGVDLDVRRPAAEQRVGRGEEHGEGQVEPHRRRERREDHPAPAPAAAAEAPRRFLGPQGGRTPPARWGRVVSGSGSERVKATRLSLPLCICRGARTPRGQDKRSRSEVGPPRGGCAVAHRVSETRGVLVGVGLSGSADAWPRFS